MAFLTVKTVKGYRYLYYCERRRSRVKDGGSGDVRSTDILIGRLLFFDYVEFQNLGWWVWDGLSIDKLIASLWRWQVSDLPDYLNTSASIDFPSSRKIIVSWDGVDGRSKQSRTLKRSAKRFLDMCFKDVKNIDAAIDRSAYYLHEHRQCNEKVRKLELKHAEWRKKPSATWMEGGTSYTWADEAGDIIQDSLDYWRNSAAWYLEKYCDTLESLFKSCPRSIRDRAKVQTENKAERLAADLKFIERYRRENFQTEH